MVTVNFTVKNTCKIKHLPGMKIVFPQVYLVSQFLNEKCLMFSWRFKSHITYMYIENLSYIERPSKNFFCFILHSLIWNFKYNDIVFYLSLYI